jgi:hypothetical protein
VTAPTEAWERLRKVADAINEYDRTYGYNTLKYDYIPLSKALRSALAAVEKEERSKEPTNAELADRAEEMVTATMGWKWAPDGRCYVKDADAARRTLVETNEVLKLAAKRLREADGRGA